MAERKRLGDLLVEAKVISGTQLQAALGHQRQWGGKIGTSLIELGFITEDVLAKFLSFQLNYPSVSLGKLKVTPEVLAKIPREMQEKHLCVPVAVIKEGRRESLVVAMSDPTDVRALDEISFRVGGKVKPVIATEGSLKQFLFGGTSRASRPSVVSGTHTERTDEFEVIRGTMPAAGATGHTPAGGVTMARNQGGHAAVGASHVPVGEHTVDLDEEPPPAPAAEPEEILLEETVEPSVERPAARPPTPPPMPANPPAGEGDSFASLLRANASGAPAVPPLPPPPAVAAPPAGALDSLFASSPSAPIPDEDHTEPDIQVVPRPAARPAVAVTPPWQRAPAPPEPPAPEPAAASEPPVEDWTGATTPGGAPVEAGPIGSAPADDSVPEISLPGPEPSAIPAEIAPNLAGINPLLQPEPQPPESPSRVFAVPADLMMEAPPPPAPAPAGPAPDEAPAAGVTEPDAPASPVETWEAPIETWNGPLPEVPPAPPAEDLAPPEAPADPPHPEDHEPTVPMQDPVPPMREIGHAGNDAGAVPSGANLDPQDDERTILGPGAEEPTWLGEPEPEAPAMPDRTRLSIPVPPAETSVPEYTATRESPPEERATADALSTEHAWAGETAPGEPEAPPVSEPPVESWSAPVAQAEMPVESMTPSTRAPDPEPSVTPPPAPPPEEPSGTSRLVAAASPTSDEQAALNAMVSKKLKLLNAITELLLEKGLITEDEIKEKVAKKKG